MKKQISMKELEEKIEEVLDIAPFLNTEDIWLALLKKYPLSSIEKIMKKRKKERLERIEKEESEYEIIDLEPEFYVGEDNISLNEVIKDAEKKKIKK